MHTIILPPHWQCTLRSLAPWLLWNIFPEFFLLVNIVSSMECATKSGSTLCLQVQATPVVQSIKWSQTWRHCETQPENAFLKKFGIL
eukprot:1077569-Amphidinium_carterae.1